MVLAGSLHLPPLASVATLLSLISAGSTSSAAVTMPLVPSNCYRRKCPA